VSNDKIVNQTIAHPGSTVTQTIHQTITVSESQQTIQVPYFYPEYIGETIFVGRDREMVDLHALLQQNERVAIAAVGMSGVGKTALARHYVMAHGADYPGGVWWLSAGQMVTDILGYVERMGMRSELPTNFTEVQIVQYYFDRWHEGLRESKLLVLDDVEDYGAVKGLLPKQGSFQVLMTTKVRFGKPVKRLDLGVLEPEAALLLLRSHMEDDDRLDGAIEVARELCEWLGCLPLAIELVGRYLSQTGTIAGVLGQLKAKRGLGVKAISKVWREMDYGLNVRDAIELSWGPLEEDARRVAMVAGVFALAPIELEWLQDCLPDLEDVSDILDLELVNRSLVEKTEKSYRLHSLVREFLREKLAATENGDEVRRSFAQLMTEIAKTIDMTGRTEMLNAVRSAISHLEAATTYVRLLEKEDDRIRSFTGLLRFYQGQSLWTEAEDWADRCCKFATDYFGDRHPETATSLNNLAVLYKSMGQYERALPLYESALEIRRSELGDRHPSTAGSLNNLAELYQSMGQYERALPLYESALEINRSKLGDRHPSTATSLNNLAGLYSSMGQYERALPLYESALEIRQSELGDRHPDTAMSLSSLAALYYSMGQYERALPLYESALEINRSELGDRHPSTAMSLNNLASLYYSMGQYERALPLFESALKIKRSELGDRHPDTATSLNNLAGLYSSMGQYERALPLYESALEIYRSELGDRHPSTATSLNNLAHLYESMGQYERALPLLESALEIRQSELGDRHPSTAGSLNNLAELYQSMGQYERALPLYESALEILRSELGDRHPDTATSLNNLALLYYRTNRLPEAATMLSDVVNILEELLGPNHPNTVKVRTNLEAIQQAMAHGRSSTIENQ
jgi:tetratricopeptide (TPR) repeat protein